MSLDKVVEEWVEKNKDHRHLSLRNLATTAYRVGMKDQSSYPCDLGWALAKMRKGKILISRSYPGRYYWLQGDYYVVSGNEPDKSFQSKLVNLTSYMIRINDWAIYDEPIE